MSNKTVKVLGIDIGASKIAAVVWDGEIGKKIYKPYPPGAKRNFKTWLSWVQKLLKEFLKGQNIVAAGAAVAGVVLKGKVLKSPNFPILDGVNLGREFSGIVGKPVEIENDVRTFLWAESQLGSARDKQNVVGLTLGTGIGGAILIAGEIYTGKNGSAGEVGHMVLEGEKTFETLASSRALGGQLAKKLTQEAERGDKDAKKALRKILLPLGRGLANIVNILDPEAIIIGGGIGEAWDLLEDAVRIEMEKFIISPASRNVEILKAQFGDFAPALGAALLAEKFYIKHSLN